MRYKIDPSSIATSAHVSYTVVTTACRDTAPSCRLCRFSSPHHTLISSNHSLNGLPLLACPPIIPNRRTRGDLIESGKIMTGKEAISAHKSFEVSMENRTKGHGYKLYKNRTGIRRNRFLSERVVNPWNDLDKKTVTVDTVEKFKRQMSEFGY